MSRIFNLETRMDVAAAGRIFLKEFDAFWADPLHMKHPEAEAYSYLRSARDAFEASLRPMPTSDQTREGGR